MDGWDPFASSEDKTPGITISDLSWPPIDSTTSAPNAPPASGEAEAGALEWPDLSAQSSANNSGQEIENGLSEIIRAHFPFSCSTNFKINKY